MKHIIFAAAAAITLASCGDTSEQAAELQSKADAAIEERAVGDALVSAVDQEAIKGMAHGAAKEALREALPAAEIAAVGAVIDEEALIAGLGKAVDAQALEGAVRGSVNGAARQLEERTKE